MRGGRGAVAIAAWALAASACGPGTAVEALEGSLLFYRWPHGAGLRSDEVARLRAEEVRSLWEIEEFRGSLADWEERTGPIRRLRIGPEDFVYGSHFFVYYLACLREPAFAPTLELRIQRQGPDGVPVWDHVEFPESRMNRRAQAGGVLFSMHGMPAGEHRLHFEIVDRDRVAAAGDLLVDYEPGPAGGQEPPARR